LSTSPAATDGFRDQLLVTARHLGLGADDFDRRQRADLDLLLVVVVEFRPGERLLLHLDVLAKETMSQ
jgi:hypothetical protein